MKNQLGMMWWMNRADMPASIMLGVLQAKIKYGLTVTVVHVNPTQLAMIVGLLSNEGIEIVSDNYVMKNSIWMGEK